MFEHFHRWTITREPRGYAVDLTDADQQRCCIVGNLEPRISRRPADPPLRSHAVVSAARPRQAAAVSRTNSASFAALVVIYQTIVAVARQQYSPYCARRQRDPREASARSFAPLPGRHTHRGDYDAAVARAARGIIAADRLLGSVMPVARKSRGPRALVAASIAASTGWSMTVTAPSAASSRTRQSPSRSDFDLGADQADEREARRRRFASIGAARVEPRMPIAVAPARAPARRPDRRSACPAMPTAGPATPPALARRTRRRRWGPAAAHGR